MYGQGPYVVDSYGPALGQGATHPQLCGIAGVLKRNSPTHAYVVANEFVCGRLALLVGLNAPPGVMIHTDSDELAYVSLFFGGRNYVLPPPVDGAEVARVSPFAAAGIVAFDCWIANWDRHEKNMAFAPRLQIPVTIYDHSHCLLGAGGPGTGIGHLEQRLNRPYASPCLQAHLDNGAHLAEWQTRIRAIPDEILAELCQVAVHEGAMDEDESLAVNEFLANRKRRIIKLLKELQANEGVLAGVTQWGLEEE